MIILIIIIQAVSNGNDVVTLETVITQIIVAEKNKERGGEVENEDVAYGS